MRRHDWIGAYAHLTQKRQCVLAGVARAAVVGCRQLVWHGRQNRLHSDAI
jgi:hypothetical protein